MRIPRLGINLVPPSESNQSTSGDVLKVIEVDCEEEDCDDEYEDT